MAASVRTWTSTISAGLTANTTSVDNPVDTSISIGSLFQIASQALANNITGAPWHIGRWAGFEGSAPSVPQANVYLKGVAAFTTTSGAAARVSGDYFNDYAMNGRNLWQCPATADCAGIGMTRLTVQGSSSGNSVSFTPGASATGNLPFYFYGDQYAEEFGAPLRLDLTTLGLATDFLDTGGGNGLLIDINNTGGQIPQAHQVWLRNANASLREADGTFPRFGIGMDNLGGLLFYQPCTETFTGAISGTTPTQTITVSSPSGGCGGVQLGMLVRMNNSVYGQSSYGVITAGSGTSFTITTTSQQTVSAVTMIGDGQLNFAALDHVGNLNLGAGGLTATGADSTLRGVIATTDPSQFGAGTRSAVWAFACQVGRTVHPLPLPSAPQLLLQAKLPCPAGRRAHRARVATISSRTAESTRARLSGTSTLLD